MTATILATLLATALCAAPAGTEPSALDEATAAWEAGDWATAAEAFGRAYEDEPSNAVLWAHAQALRKSEQYEAAIAAYERFVETGPPEQDRKAAQIHIEACRRALAEATPEPVSDPVSEPETEPEPEPEPQPDPGPQLDTPRRRPDGLGIGLLAGGAAVAGIGVGLVVGAHVIEGRSGTSPTEDGYRDDIGRAQVLQGVGIGALAVGGALLVGGVVRLVVMRRRGDALAGWSTGAGTGWSMRF